MSTSDMKLTTTKRIEFQNKMERAFEAMSIDWLQHQKVKRLATISEYCFRLGVELAGTLIDIECEISKEQGEQETLERINAIIKNISSGARHGFTYNKAKNESLKVFLTETIKKINNGESPRKSEDKIEKATETIQPPVAETDCCLEKGTPIFHGNKDELVRNWLFVVSF